MCFCKNSLKIPKGVIRIDKLKDRQQNNPKKTDKQTNNDLQNITYKTNDRVARTSPNSEGVSKGETVPAPLVAPLVLL